MSKDGIKKQIDERTPFSKQDVKDAANQTRNAAQNNDGSVDARSGASVAANKIAENIPQEHKDQAREYRDRTQNYLKEKIPEERRDQAIWRLRKMIAEIQGHQDCMLSMVL